MIKLKNVNKNLGDFQVKDINLKIEEEEHFIILGPTGTGKSVLLELIAGLQSPEKGSIYFGTEKVNDVPPEERKIGMVYQDYMLFPHLNVKENILFGLKIRGKPKDKQKRKLEEISSLLGIDHLLSRSVETLSGGEQQRVALARALIISPRILLLDEPLSALDPNTKEKLQQDLKEIHDELGTTTLHVTHDFNEALALADKIAIMRQGKIVQTGTPEEVFQCPESDFVAEFVGSKNIFGGEVVQADGHTKVKFGTDLTVTITNEAEGKVNLIIRPEDIIISTQSFTSSARNCYQGVITEVQKRVSLVEIKVDVGVELTSYITYHSFQKMELEVGDEVYITFKASAVHIY